MKTFKKLKIFNSSIIFILYLVLLVSIQSTLYSQVLNNNGNDAWFAKWHGDKKSAFSFSFDDGFISHYENVRPILNQFDFNGTFYVMPPFLTDTLPGIWRYGTWQMFTEMSLEDHEIGSHTMNHLHLTQLPAGDTLQEGTILYEIYQARQIINQRLPNQRCITLAYPFAEHNLLVETLTSLFYESARADGLLPNESSVPDSEWYKLKAIEVLFNAPRISLSDDLDELQSIKDWIQTSANEEAWGILLGHEVVPQDSLPGLLAAGAWHPFSNEWFTLLCEWADSKKQTGELWIETIANVTRYIKERDNAFYSFITQTELQIQLVIDDNLDDTIYDFPVSTFIKVPGSWEYALFTQEGTVDTLEVFVNDSGHVVLAEIIPNNSVVTLDKLNTSSANSPSTFVSEFKLFQNYPNPFNPTTTIQYSVEEYAIVKLIIYDLLGNKIKTLVDEDKTAGLHSATFNAANLSSGVYFYSLQAGKNIQTRKMTVMK